MSIGANIACKRKSNAWTQKYLANLMNVSDKTISSWENERTYPDIESLIVLSDILNLSLDELIKEDIDMVKHLDKELQEGRRWRKWKWVVIVASVLAVGFILLNIAWVAWTNHRQSQVDNYTWENLGPHTGTYYAKTNPVSVILVIKPKQYISYLEFDTSVRRVWVSDSKEKSKRLTIENFDEITFTDGEGHSLNLDGELNPVKGTSFSKKMTKKEQETFYRENKANIEKFYKEGFKLFSDFN